MHRITSLSLSLSLPLKLLVLCDTFLYSTIRASDACSVIFLYPDRNDMTSPRYGTGHRTWVLLRMLKMVTTVFVNTRCVAKPSVSPPGAQFRQR